MKNQEPPSGATPFAEIETDALSLGVFVLYDDQTNAALAKSSLLRVTRQLDLKASFSVRTWTCAELRHATLREMAALEAGKADLVVVAVRGGEPTPEIRSWVRAWVDNRITGACAVAVLRNRPRAMEEGAPDPVAEFWQDLAREEAFDLFMDGRMNEISPPENLYEKFAGQVESSSHFGINE